MSKKKRVEPSYNKERSHKIFWISFGALFLISLLTLISSQGITITGQATVHPISFLKGGSQFDFEIRNVEGLKSASMEIKQDVTKALITVENIEKTSWEFKGRALHRFKIDSSDKDKFGQITLTLRLKEIDVRGKENYLYLNREEIKLLQIPDPVREEADYVYYQAIASSMGEFVIGKKEVVKKAEPITEEKEPIVAKAIEPPVQKGQEEPVKRTSAFNKIKEFFRNLFS